MINERMVFMGGKMSRITIMIEKDLERKLRIVQGKKIAEAATGVSFSEVLNDVIRKGLA